jgi:DNA polymerase-3 subunit alpha
MDKPYVHLHNHSEYSMLDSTNRVQQLANKAKSYGMPAVGLTDHGNLFGLIYFEQACQKAGVKPILGCEVYVAPKSRHDKSGSANDERRYYHLCLYCKNETGYHNLLKLTSLAYTEGYYYRPRIDMELLEQYHEGLICSSACLAGEISAYLIDGNYDKAKERALYYSQLFGEGNYYLEVQDHGLPQDKIIRRDMKKLSEETGIPLIATNDVHYMEKEDEKDTDVFICIGTQKKRSDQQRMHASPQCYFRSPDEMYELFADMPEALLNTVKLAESCSVTIPKPGPLLPEYTIPDEYQSKEHYMRELVYQGLAKRYKSVTDDIKKRADFELKTIFDMGFVGYFLIVWDFIKWAKDQHISVGPGRGSGAGSIVAYALRITDIDPLKYNLLFERFLNPERVSMPDFDIDFSDERRDEVVEYVTTKYGRDHVAGIATYGTLATKAVLKDVARVLDISFAESNEITKAVPDDARNVMDAAQKSDILKAFQQRGGVYSELFEVAGRLEGLVRHIGTHACGKVIGRTAVSDYVPLIYDQKAGSVNTAFESKLIEDCGLVKMDFLGLTTLSIIDRCIEMIHQTQPDFDLEQVTEEDVQTFELFSEGRTHGIFQFESDGMQKILKEAKPTSIEDLIALNALYRPGPMQFIPEFIEGKRAPQKVKYFDKTLKAILEPTYGVIVYQEQVMQVAQEYAGYSLGAADLLRRAMGKKKPEEMAKQQAIFIEGAQKLGHDKESAEKLFHILEPFAGYGFNKSHAAAYSMLAYKTAYLKAHYPHEFMAAVLTSQINSPDSFNASLDEIRGMGLSLEVPDINHSGRFFEAKNHALYYGMLGIKGVGEAIVDAILKERAKGHFKNFIDFVQRLSPCGLNKRVGEVLVYAGLFDRCETQYNRKTLLHNIEKALAWASKQNEEKQQGASLFGDAEDVAVTPYVMEPCTDDIPMAERLVKEKEILGFYVSGHPLEKYRGAWQTLVRINLAQLNAKEHEKKPHDLVGLVRDIEQRQTKKGDKMAMAVLEDFNGTIKIVLFQKALDKSAECLQENAAVQLRGYCDFSRGEVQFLVDEIKWADDSILATVAPIKVDTSPALTAANITLHWQSSEHSNEELKRLQQIILANRGSSPITLCLRQSNKEVVNIRFGKRFNINWNEDTQILIKQLGGYIDAHITQ